MPKGKKFNAAEKHFHGKQLKYEQEIKTLNCRLSKLTELLMSEQSKNTQLSKDLADITSRHEKLLAYSQLTEQDLATALESDKAMANLKLVAKLFSAGPIK